MLAPPLAGAAQELPEAPALRPDILATVDDRPVHGHISARRSTQDGRVRVSGAAAGTARWFYTSRPEVYRRDLAAERRTSDGKRLAAAADLFHASTAAGARPGHLTICDPYLAAGTVKNPYACGGDRQADCYDVTVVMAVNVPAAAESRSAVELWSTPIRIRVAGPKTRRARVSTVERRGTPVRSPITRPPRRGGDTLLEPVTTGDGRLLILNSGDSLFYSVMDRDATPCDARGWRRLAHLSEAHEDPRMTGYGLARYPLRDSENRSIKSGKPLRGAYPWVDRAGDTLFFTQAGRDGLFYRGGGGSIRSRFELLEQPAAGELELGGPTRFAVSYFGLWSQGKVVIPDSRVNNIDFHTGSRGYRPSIRLYSGGSEWVELERASVVDINSPESEWSYHEALLPRAPRDVVWWLSSNRGMTDEVIFDDALDPGTLVFSPMNAAVHNAKRSWRDGFDARRSGYVKSPRIQNAAATELLWDLPAYGTLSGGRVEPVAAGGVRGKGLWLDGALTRVEYRVPRQRRDPAMRQATWTSGLWIDPRDLDERRRLLSFPDGSWLDLEADALVLGDTAQETRLELPPGLELQLGEWRHLAFVTTPGWMDVYLDGFRLATLQGSALRPQPGRIVVGHSPSAPVSGFRGWVDELRIVSGERAAETLCNDAHGTLRGLDSATRPAAFAQAAAYPAAFHDEISASLAASERRTWERYACERRSDRAHPCLVDRQRFTAREPTCVGRALAFPEGPLFADRPRPDSRANTSCLACHVAAHPTAGLRIGGPLAAGAPGTALADDERRQPRQAPARLHGVVPPGFLGLPGGLAAPPEGLALDPLLYPVQ